jgi:imidazolonepropionase-like amidohydrolase
MTIPLHVRLLTAACMMFIQIDSLAASGQTIAFVHVGVIPMDQKRVLDDSTVLISNDRIVQVGPASAVAIPREAMVIDGQVSTSLSAPK